jgi:hypothetical protein
MVATVKYEIVRKLSKVEIRQYPSIVILGLRATKMKASDFCFVSFQAKTSRKQK